MSQIDGKGNAVYGIFRHGEQFTLHAALDEALEILAPYGIALSNGNSNHAPMVAEALCAMDRPDAVSAWIARYRERMLPRPEISARIRREDWRGALGDRRRFADWSGFFAEELREVMAQL